MTQKSLERFVLFTGDYYYPSGGWHDFTCFCVTKEHGIEEAARIKADWKDIVDLSTGQIVWSSKEHFGA